MRKLHLLLACATTLLWATCASAEVFHLAVLPDTQDESGEDPQRFVSRLDWLIEQKSELNLKMVLHVGDLHNWDTPDHDQFVRTSGRLQKLNTAGIPYAIALGNHDTAAVKVGGSAAPGNTNTNLRITTTFNTYYPPERFAARAGSYEEGKTDNAFHTFSAGGLDWMVINLELWPRQQVIDWAKTVVAKHPAHNVIILTHSYLSAKGDIEQGHGGYGDTGPQHLFDEVIKPNPNVKMVFCGHGGTAVYSTATSAGGNTVHQFLQCYHSRTNPVRLVAIDTEKGTISTRVYCPMTEETMADGAVSVKDVAWVRGN